MLNAQGMETFDARLASFGAPRPAGKKRASSAKGAKGAKAQTWPHASPSAEQLAQAGFFFCPERGASDNVSCFHCHKSFAGWEEEDDPVQEHLTLASDCAWAIQMRIEHDMEEGKETDEDPMSERLVEARKSTFGTAWPHEGKRGWNCKTQAMAESGWYYCPTAESEDFARCPYCSLSLDGWEPKDKPYDEHKRRSPECCFFTISQSLQPKATKGKKGRVSKASRISLQYNVAIANEDRPLSGSGLNTDLSVLTAATDITVASLVSTMNKKAGRSKKVKGKTTAKAKVKGEELSAFTLAEPEGDDYEVKMQKVAKKPSRGRKRKSSEMDLEVKTAQEIAPLTKRPNTRTRGSTISTALDQSVVLTELDDDTQMTDAELMPPPSLLSSKKGAKGRKRASSTTRKVSGRVAASQTASETPVSDDAIDAALEADLDRPLTDDEDDIEDVVETKPKRRLTRTRPASKPRPSSVAPTGRRTRGSVAPAEPEIVRIVVDASEQESVRQSFGFEVEPESAADDVAIDAPDEEELPNSGHLSDVVVVAASRPKRGGKKTNTASKAKAKPAKKVAAAKKVSEETVIYDPSKAEDVDMDPRADEVALTDAKDTNQSSTFEDVPENEQPVVEAEEPTEVNQSVSPVVEKQPIKSTKVTKAKAKRGRPKAKQISATFSEPEIHLSTTNTSLSSQDGPIRPTTPITTTTPTIASIHQQQSQPQPNTTPTPTIHHPLHPPPIPSSSRSTIVLSTPAAQIPSPTPSPQSSNAENQAPSSRPSQTRPMPGSPSPAQRMRSPARLSLAAVATTPKSSPARLAGGGLCSTAPWIAADLGRVFERDDDEDGRGGKESVLGLVSRLGEVRLSSPEKKMSVEEWVRWNAGRGEEKLRGECERVIGLFENQGMRALKALEGIVVE